VATERTDVDASEGSGAHDQAEGDRVDVQNPTTFDFNASFTWHAYVSTTRPLDLVGAELDQLIAGGPAAFVR